MMTDPIADMLTRIRNASLSKKMEVLLPFSKIKFAIGEILYKGGYLNGVERKETDDREHELLLKLKYSQDKQPSVRGIRRVSKPGCRIYVTKDQLPTVASGYGMAILSTSKGLMTNKEAKKQGLGGEVICEVW